MPYATVAEVKASADTTDAQWDGVIQQAINAAEQAINKHCKRPDGFVALVTATVREVNGTGRRDLVVWECVAVTKVEQRVGDIWTEIAGTDYKLFAGDPKYPRWHRAPYERLMRRSNFFVESTDELPNFRVTGRWGYADTIEPQVKLATISQATRWWKRGQSNWADTLAMPDFGALLFRQSLDPDIQQMLSTLVRAAI